MWTTVLNALPRVLLGLFMLIIGLNKFLEFIPIPSPEGDGGLLMGIYQSSGFLSLIGGLQILGGLGLLMNRALFLALIFITAIMFNATVFHLLHDPGGIGGAAFCLGLALVVFAQRRSAYWAFLKA